MHIFVGIPGSGKTYFAVKKILDHIKLGRKIYTNIEGMDVPECRKAIQDYCDINDSQLESRFNFLTEEQAQYFWLHIEPGYFVVIDDFHKLFSNRSWNEKVSKDLLDWVSRRRHEGYGVIFITQDLKRMDQSLRNLVESTCIFSKVKSNDDCTEDFLVNTFRGDDYRCWPEMTETVRTYEKAVFDCFKSVFRLVTGR